MTVPRAYLREMKAKQEKQKRRQEIEEIGNPALLRLLEVEEKYEDQEDPMRLFIAQVQEIVRKHAIEAGVCDACLAKFPDPLADSRQTAKRGA